MCLSKSNRKVGKVIRVVVKMAPCSRGIYLDSTWFCTRFPLHQQKFTLLNVVVHEALLWDLKDTRTWFLILWRMTVALNEMKLPQIFSEAEYIVSVSPSNPVSPSIGIGWNIAQQEPGILTICVLLIRVTRPKVSHVPDSYSGIFAAWSLKPLDCKLLIKQMATIDRYWIWHLIGRKQRKWVVIPYELYFLQMRLQHVQMLTDINEFCFQLVFVSCTRTNIIENAACQDLCFHFDAIVGLIEHV